MAKFLGSFESNTPEWYALREGAIGGSDVPAVLGVSPWKSALSLHYELTGAVENPFEDNASMRLGRLLERGMFDNLVAEHPDWVCVYQPGTFAHDEFEWCHSNPDVFVDTPDGRGIVDLKYSASWWDSVPDNYLVQVRFYLWIHDYDFGLIAGLIGGRWREFRVERDRFFEEAMLARLFKFWDGVQNNVVPDWDGSDSTYETMRQVYSSIENDSVELGSLGVELFNAEIGFAEAKAQLNKAKSKTLAMLGEAKNGLLNGEVICYRQKSSTGTPYLKMKG